MILIPVSIAQTPAAPAWPSGPMRGFICMWEVIGLNSGSRDLGLSRGELIELAAGSRLRHVGK